MSNPTWLPQLGWDDYSKTVCLHHLTILTDADEKEDHIGHLLMIGPAFVITPDPEVPNV